MVGEAPAFAGAAPLMALHALPDEYQ